MSRFRPKTRRWSSGSYTAPPISTTRVNLAFSDKAVERALDALRRGCNIVTDTNMARSGINKTAAAKLGCEIHCFMSDPDIAEITKERGCTRGRVDGEGGGAHEAADIRDR